MRVDAERSSLTFVRPFLFDPDQADALFAQAETAQAASREGQMPVWERVAFPTADWLPHLAEAVVPTPDRPPVVAWFRLTNQFLQSDRGMAAAGGFEFTARKTAAPLPLALDAVHLLLFRNGVGFVAQRWTLPADAPAAWLDLQHFGRFAALDRGGSLRAAPNPDGAERSFPDPFNRRPAADPARYRDGTFADLDTIALDSLDLGPGQQTPLRDVFIAGRTLPYAVLFLRDAGDPDWPRDRVLYKLRNLLHSTQPVHPAPEQAAVAPPHFHTYLKDQWFYVSLEGGGFAAVDAPADDFFRHALPNHLRTEYFLLFVFALQQRFSLMALSAEVARHWRSHPAEQSRRDLRAVFERIRDRLFDFTARYQFAQVGQRENHHRVYQLWRERFQTRELYDEVCGEVREMSEYLQDRDKQARERRVGVLTLLLTVFIGAPSLAIGFWNINIKGFTSTEGLDLREAVELVMKLAAALALLLGAGYTGVWFLLRRK